MDENMKLIMAEFAKINTKLDNLDTRVSGLEKTMVTALDELQDHFEKLDADVRVVSGTVASGFYRTKHQIEDLTEQWDTLVKVLQYKDVLPLDK